MSGGRIWLLVGAVAGVLVILLGWVVGASPLLAQADSADVQRRDVEILNEQYEATLRQMQVLDSKKDDLVAEYGDLKDSVPAALDLEGYFDWVAVAANRATVVLAAATADGSQAYSPGGGAAGSVVLDAGFQSKLRLVQVTISAGGDVEQMAAFLQLLQSDGRLQLINTAKITFGTSLTAQITGYIFVIDDPRLVALTAALGGQDAEPGSAPDQAPVPAPDDSESPSPDESDSPSSGDVDNPAARG